MSETASAALRLSFSLSLSPHKHLWLVNVSPGAKCRERGSGSHSSDSSGKRAGRCGGEQATAAQTLLGRLPDTNQRVRAGESAVREGETDKRR